MEATALEWKLYLSLFLVVLIVMNLLCDGSSSNMEWPRCLGL